MEPRSAPASDDAIAASAVAIDPPAIPRQRWRLVLARDVTAIGTAIGLAGREFTDAWEAAIEETGLPLYRPVGRARARVAFGAPVPAGIALERELADIVLIETVPGWRVREALAGRLPEGWRLIDSYDVWLGAPALAGQVAAADYRIDLGDADERIVTAAARALFEAERLPRERVKGGETVTYDLRPLIVDVSIADAGPPLIVEMRTRFHPVLGTGRPEEVVAALADIAGASLEMRTVVRERLILAEDLEVGS